MNSYIAYISDVFRFKPDIYEKANNDTELIRDSILVVLASSLAAGIGSVPRMGVLSLFIVTIGSLINWLIWSYLVYIISTRMLLESQDEIFSHIRFFRVVGFASIPGFIRILAVFPQLYLISSIAAHILMIISMVIAVRYLLSYNKNDWKVEKICIVSWLLMLLAAVILGSAARSLGV